MDYLGSKLGFAVPKAEGRSGGQEKEEGGTVIWRVSADPCSVLPSP